MTLDLSSLNRNQEEAVHWNDGALLVLAGPGSGKTKVLTLRIARLISESPDKPFRILALTFTNKAAAEMRERLAQLIPGASERALLTTFHSFAADILRQHGHHIGLKPDFTILSQSADRLALLDEVISSNGYRSTEVRSEKLLPIVTRLTDYNLSEEQAIGALKGSSFSNPEEIASIYAKYRSRMIANGTIDFGGLVGETLNLLMNNRGVRKQLQRVYSYICVDEFQDTNSSQYSILQNIIPEKTNNVFVVADDDQIIYQWNGASPERITTLLEDFQAEVLQLPENYRCPPPVVVLANKLIVNNFGRYADKHLLTANKSPGTDDAVALRRFETFDLEAAAVASQISQLTPSEKSETVVLARTKKVLEKMVMSLEEAGVPAYLATRKNEFESPPLQWLHSILRLANTRGRADYLRSLCKSFFTLEGINIDPGEIVTLASAEEEDYLRSWASVVLSHDGLSREARSLIENSIIPKLADRLLFWDFVADAFDWLDRLPDISPDKDGVFDEYAEEQTIWRGIVQEIVSQYGRDEVTLHLLLQEFDLRSKSPQPAKGAVPCYTIHASKGMEFNHVYLVGMVEDQLPSWAAVKKGSESHEMQEERRNCFVAITRAQESLHISYSDLLFGWRKRPSRFLSEMGLM